MVAATDPAWLDGGRMLPLVEDFYTIQGEGFHAGKPAYFIRLGGGGRGGRSGCRQRLAGPAAGATPSIRGTRNSIRRPMCRP